LAEETAVGGSEDALGRRCARREEHCSRRCAASAAGGFGEQGRRPMAAAAAEETSARETVGRYLGTHLYAVGRKGGGQSRRTNKGGGEQGLYFIE